MTVAGLQEAQQKKVALTSRCAVEVPDRAAIDMRQMTRVANNLVSGTRSIGSPKGGSVRIERVSHAAMAPSSRDQLTFEGARPEDIATTLKLFFGDEDVRSQANETTRLRLALADAVVRAHGSEIRPQRIGDQGLRLVFALTEDGDRATPAQRHVILSLPAQRSRQHAALRLRQVTDVSLRRKGGYDPLQLRGVPLTSVARRRR